MRPTLETFLRLKWQPRRELGAPALCVVTRIRPRRRYSAIGVRVWYWRVRRRATRVPGVVATSATVRGDGSIYLISLWRDHDAMARFATAAPEHAAAVAWLRRKGANTWTALYDVRGVSRSSSPWEETDHRPSEEAQVPGSSEKISATSASKGGAP